MNRSPALRRMVCGWSLAAVGAYALLGPVINPSVAVTDLLRIDLMILALLGALLPQLAAGGLLGAGLMAPWIVFPWLMVPALGLAWSRKGDGRGPGRERSGLAVLILAAAANCGLLGAATAHGLRVSPEDFAARDFPVNDLLADVPVHDVWAVDLEGHRLPTLRELGDALKRGSPLQATPVSAGLVLLRGMIGTAFGWDDPRWSNGDSSFVDRLTEADRRCSAAEPGTTLGIWRVLYACPREGVVETVNGTVHVAVAASLGEGPKGPRLFLSFRVREVNWTTRFYMRLIDPARRYFVYPSLLRQLAHTWEREGWRPLEDPLDGEEQ